MPPRNIVEWMAGGNLPPRRLPLPEKKDSKLVHSANENQPAPSITEKILSAAAPKVNAPTDKEDTDVKVARKALGSEKSKTKSSKTIVKVTVSTDTEESDSDAEKKPSDSTTKKQTKKRVRFEDDERKSALKNRLGRENNKDGPNEDFIEIECRCERCQVAAKKHPCEDRCVRCCEAKDESFFQRINCRQCVRSRRVGQQQNNHNNSHNHNINNTNIANKRPNSQQKAANPNNDRQNNRIFRPTNTHNTLVDSQSKNCVETSIRLSDFSLRNMTRLIQPSRSEVVIREDVIEIPSDPRPNAFYDARSGILRIYHGPNYGNPFTTLVPLSINSNIPIGTPSPYSTQAAWGAMGGGDASHSFGGPFAPYTLLDRVTMRPGTGSGPFVGRGAGSIGDNGGGPAHFRTESNHSQQDQQSNSGGGGSNWGGRTNGNNNNNTTSNDNNNSEWCGSGDDPASKDDYNWGRSNNEASSDAVGSNNMPGGWSNHGSGNNNSTSKNDSWGGHNGSSSAAANDINTAGWGNPSPDAGPANFNDAGHGLSEGNGNNNSSSWDNNNDSANDTWDANNHFSSNDKNSNTTSDWNSSAPKNANDKNNNNSRSSIWDNQNSKFQSHSNSNNMNHNKSNNGNWNNSTIIPSGNETALSGGSWSEGGTGPVPVKPSNTNNNGNNDDTWGNPAQQASWGDPHAASSSHEWNQHRQSSW